VVSFLAPVYLLAGAGVAGAVLALHFIVMRQPPSDVLPTARFLPARPAVARTVARRPDDVLLLLVRMAAALLIAAAFARPVWRPPPGSVLHIVVADRSRAMADTVRRLLGPDGVLVTTDSLIPAGERVLSPALIRAMRAAVRLGARWDSIEVTVVSPALAGEVDAATDSIRAAWPGRIRLVRVRADSAASPAAAAVVEWSDSGGAGHRRPTIDTVGAVVADGGRAVWVAPFVRRWRLDTAGGRVVARWVDGEPAAVERATGDGCHREVMMSRPSDGDLALRPEVRRFAAVMARPCGHAAFDLGVTPARWDVDSTRPVRVASRTVVPRDRVPSPGAAWLLAAGLALLLIEPLARRWRRGGA
jgi:Aerotolerance regulator N-terminal